MYLIKKHSRMLFLLHMGTYQFIHSITSLLTRLGTRDGVASCKHFYHLYSSRTGMEDAQLCVFFFFEGHFRGPVYFALMMFPKQNVQIFQNVRKNSILIPFIFPAAL